MLDNFDVTHLLEPQKEHAKFLCQSLIDNRMSWDGSATGTGKTFSTCAILRHMKQKFVVICPKLAIPQWKEVLTKYGLSPEWILNYEKLARGNTPYYKYISQNKYRKLHGIDESIEIPEFCRAMFKIPSDWVVVLDESHKMKGVDSLNAGLLFNLKLQNYQVHLMSATQATTPLDMKAFGFLMGLHDGTMKGFKAFAEEAGAKWTGKYGAQYFDSEDAESMAKLAKVRDFLFNLKRVGARLTRKDFGDIFPKTQVVAEAYDMGAASDKIAQVYDDMEMELARLEEKCLGYKEHILAVITKSRRLAELLKVPTMVEMAMDFHKEGRSTVLFVNYQDTIDALVLRLSKEYGIDFVGQIHGGVSFKQRIIDIEKFKLDLKTFMVCNLAAGGSCINLHDILGGRPRSSIINPSYSAIGVLQSAGRIDRAYAQSDVYQRFLFAARTIEETSVVPRFNDKNRFVTALNDGTLSDADLIPAHLFKFARGMNI